MSKTIKIIDLLNKIANGEEVPKQVRFGNKLYKYDKEVEDYKDDDGYFLFDGISDSSVKNFLNDTVEIIEEQEEIKEDLEEIKEIETFVSVDTRLTFEENLKKIDSHEVNFYFKINEIIRKHNKMVKYLEQLDNKLNEK